MKIKHHYLYTAATSIVCTLGCLQIPAYPQLILVEQCTLVPKNRLFNTQFFQEDKHRVKIQVIRDVGSEFRNEEILLKINTLAVASLLPWETTSVFLTPGEHKIEIVYPRGAIFAPQADSNTININVSPNFSHTIRINLGNSKNPIRLATQ